MDRSIALIFAVFFLGVAFAAPNDDEGRIVGGRKATPGEYNFMCSLQKQNENGYQKFCGATLIQQKWLLTAAHCIEDVAKSGNVNTLRVVCGSNHAYNLDEATAQVLPVHHVYIHQQFGGFLLHDIGLIELSQPANLNEWVQPIAMAPPKYDPIGKSGLNIGWGATDPRDKSITSDELMVGPAEVLTPQQCKNEHAIDLKEGQLCVFHKESSACSGDSGGPHVQKMPNGKTVQVGIVSYGSAVDCSSQAGVVTNVAYYLTWIRDVFRGNYHKYDLPK